MLEMRKIHAILLVFFILSFFEDFVDNLHLIFQISKKQHQLVKSMKQSGKSIQSKSLNCVLGDLDTLHVQPYEEFVKEEQKKLQEHWLVVYCWTALSFYGHKNVWFLLSKYDFVLCRMQLANKDLPVAHAIWRERQFQRQEITKSLEEEIEGQLKYPVEVWYSGLVYFSFSPWTSGLVSFCCMSSAAEFVWQWNPRNLPCSIFNLFGSWTSIWRKMVMRLCFRIRAINVQTNMTPTWRFNSLSSYQPPLPALLFFLLITQLYS